MSDEEAERLEVDGRVAEAHALTNGLADLLARTMGLVARAYPETFREAMGNAFDLSGYVELGQRLRTAYGRLCGDVQALSAKIDWLNKDVERLREELDQLRLPPPAAKFPKRA